MPHPIPAGHHALTPHLVIKGAAEAIEFYGLGLDAPGSGARAYWLTNDRGTGLRIDRTKTRGGTAATRTPFTFERIERTVFVAALTNNGDRENFYGAVVTSAPVSRNLTVENLDRCKKDNGWIGTGKYIVPLTKFSNDRYRLTEIPQSPGFKHDRETLNFLRIYPDTPHAREQLATLTADYHN